MEEERTLKTVDDSRTEMTKVLQHEDINGENRLFGGKLMAWIDEVACITAMRHCGGSVTTASVDTLQFKSGASLNDIIVILGKLTYVGNSSMEVRVDSYVEDRVSGMRRMINHAYLTVVHIGENGKPLRVPYGFAVESEIERAEWEGARRRIEVRKQRRKEGF